MMYLGAATCLQVPSHVRADAQRVHVVAAESAPRISATRQSVPVVPRGSSALALQACHYSPFRCPAPKAFFECKWPEHASRAPVHNESSPYRFEGSGMGFSTGQFSLLHHISTREKALQSDAVHRLRVPISALQMILKDQADTHVLHWIGFLPGTFGGFLDARATSYFNKHFSVGPCCLPDGRQQVYMLRWGDSVQSEQPKDGILKLQAWDKHPMSSGQTRISIMLFNIYKWKHSLALMCQLTQQ